MEFRPHQLARHWVADGHQVTILAGSYSHLRNRNPEFEGSTNDEWIDGVHYRWLKTPRYRGNGVMRVRSIRAYLSAVKREQGNLLDGERVDAVIASSTYPFDIDPARRIAHDHGATLVWEVHDLWPLSPMELGGYSRWNPLIWSTQRAEDRCCRHADLVVSILPNAIDHLQTRGLDEGRYVAIPNGVDLDANSTHSPDMIPDEAEVALRSLRKDHEIVVGFAGGITRSNGLESLIDAMHKLEPASAGLLLMGDGPDLEPLRQRASGHDGIRFVDRRTRQEAISTLAACDAVFVGLKKKPLYRFGIGMNKIFDAMLVARPVIASYTAGNDPIGDAACGITVPAEDVDAICEAIRTIRSMPAEQRAGLGAAGDRYVRNHHDYRVLARRFIDAIEGVDVRRNGGVA